MFDNISVPGAVAIAILVVLVLIVIVRNIYIVQQSRAYVVERLGAFHSVWGVGFHLKVPFIERVVKKVSLKEQVADFDPQPVITKDNVTMQIDTVIYFQITDPKLYTYGVEYPMNAIENLTATLSSLRSSRRNSPWSEVMVTLPWLGTATVASSTGFISGSVTLPTRVKRWANTCDTHTHSRISVSENLRFITQDNGRLDFLL